MSARFRVIVGIELVLLLMAVLVVLMPRRGTLDLINVPPDLTTYVARALTVFGTMNAVLLAVALVGWLTWIARGRPAQGPGSDDDRAVDTAEEPGGTRRRPHRRRRRS